MKLKKQKKQILRRLARCRYTQVGFFVRIYSPADTNAPLWQVIEGLNAEQTARALRQVDQTLELNRQAHGETLVHPEAPASAEAAHQRSLVTSAVCRVLDSEFLHQWKQYTHGPKIGSGCLSVIHNGVEYLAEWSGGWEDRLTYVYKIRGNGLSDQGVRILDSALYESEYQEGNKS